MHSDGCNKLFKLVTELFQVCSVELMAKHFPGHKTEEYRRMLGKFGVSGDLALQQVIIAIPKNVTDWYNLN